MKLSTRSGWVLAGAFTLAFAASPAAAQRAVQRGGDGAGQQGAGSGSQPGAPAPQGARAPSAPQSDGGRSTSTAEPKSGSTTSSGSSGSSGDGSGSRAVPYGRPREGNARGTATVRNSPPPRPGGSSRIPTYYYPLGYYPFGYGGYGFGGYYLGGPYGGFYDPWGYGYGYSRDYTMGYADDGSLRLKIKPSDASVFVDGYFAGQVDQFDGVFQRLHVEPGPHRIEIRADGYEPLFFDVRILHDRTVTFSGELKRN